MLGGLTIYPPVANCL